MRGRPVLAARTRPAQCWPSYHTRPARASGCPRCGTASSPTCPLPTRYHNGITPTPDAHPVREPSRRCAIAGVLVAIIAAGQGRHLGTCIAKTLAHIISQRIKQRLIGARRLALHKLLQRVEHLWLEGGEMLGQGGWVHKSTFIRNDVSAYFSVSTTPFFIVMLSGAKHLAVITL